MNPRFSNTSDEANTCVAFHAVHLEQLNPGNIALGVITQRSLLQCFQIFRNLAKTTHVPSSMSKEQLIN